MLYTNFSFIGMDIDRTFSYLCSIDIKKLYINQSKKQLQNPNPFEYRSNQKSQIQLSFNHSFAYQTLLTNIQIVCINMESFQNNFEIAQIQISSISSRGHNIQLINVKQDLNQNNIIISGVGVTNCIKINLIFKNQLKKKTGRNSQKQIQQSLQKLIIENIKQINLYGVNINSNPGSAFLTKLLNISENFKKYSMLQQAAETDILVAVALVNARRFVLAAQILRKASKFYVQKYNSIKNSGDLNRSTIQRTIARDFDQQNGTFHSSILGRNNYGGRILESNKFLQKAAKIQLLIAETISNPSLVLQKIAAYINCNSYASGTTNLTPIKPDIDSQDLSLSIFPQIIIFLLKVLSDRIEPFRIAALKSIQFFIQTLGCSIGSSFLPILKQVVITYPCNSSSQISSHRVPSGLQETEIVKNTEHLQIAMTIIKNKILIDHYHHLLQTLFSLMSQINKKIVLSITSQLIVPSILNKNQSYELQLYLLRFLQKSISICGADVNIQVNLIGLLLAFCEEKNIINKNMVGILDNKNQKNVNTNSKQQNNGRNGHNKHVIHNLVHFSQKILSSIKTKILPRYSGHKMQLLLQWINKTLVYLGQNQMFSNTNSHSMLVFNTILDFITSAYSIIKFDEVRLVNSPVQTILYFMNLSVYNQQAGLPYQRILDALTNMIKYHCKIDKNFELNKQIINKLLLKSKQHNLSLKQLNILVKLLQIYQEGSNQMLQWLQLYLGCIPHSTYDETFRIFCIMVEKGMKHFHNHPNKQKLLSKIIKTLLDQYTVKGKAYQQAKQSLIQNLMKNKPLNLLQLIQVCLFCNPEPKADKFYTRKKRQFSEKLVKDFEHRFDSKTYKIEYQLFLQKITFSQLIFTSILSQKSIDIAQQFTKQSFINKFFNCIKCLIESANSKIKIKAFLLIHNYLQQIGIIWKNSEIAIDSFILITRNIFSLNKHVILKLKDTKIVYSAIFTIISLLRSIRTNHEQNDNANQSQNQKIWQHAQQILNKQQNQKISLCRTKAQKVINILVFKQLLKVWSILVQCLSSPFQSVRQIYILLIIETFKEGITQLASALRKKYLQIIKPLLNNLFKSYDHTERQAGIKIYGCLLGIAGNTDANSPKLSRLINNNFACLKNFTDSIFQATFDWNQKTSQIAQNICLICLSQQKRLALYHNKKQLLKKCQNEMQNSYLSFNLEQELNFQKRNPNNFLTNLQNNSFRQTSLFQQQQINGQQVYLSKLSQQMICKINQFKQLIEKQISARSEAFTQKQSFLNQNQQQFYDIGDEKPQSIEAKQKSEDDQLEFQDLGIIQLDDQQWGLQQQKSQNVISKLTLRKNNKLSPNITNTLKLQRIRSKRFHEHQFDFSSKIIVDQLQQKIENSRKNGVSHPQALNLSINLQSNNQRQSRLKQLPKNNDQLRYQIQNINLQQNQKQQIEEEYAQNQPQIKKEREKQKFGYGDKQTKQKLEIQHKRNQYNKVQNQGKQKQSDKRQKKQNLSARKRKSSSGK